MSAFKPMAILAMVSVLATGCAHQSTARSAKTQPVVLEPSSATMTAVTGQVIAAEQGFAKSMADRDFKRFVTYLSPEAVFFSGSSVKRGSLAVAEQWRPYFDGPKAPFSWAPDHVEVLPSGQLALSTGPVYQQGKVVGRFNSIWRLESGDSWHIVFDKGEAICSPTS